MKQFLYIFCTATHTSWWVLSLVFFSFLRKETSRKKKKRKNMGSSYYGEPNLGNERGGSSRKGKKSSSDKPKQPQRGLGVAQLEKIRLHGQLGVNYLPSPHNPYPTNFNQVSVCCMCLFTYLNLYCQKTLLHHCPTSLVIL